MRSGFGVFRNSRVDCVVNGRIGRKCFVQGHTTGNSSNARIANERLDALKRDIKAAWKRAAFELHPDRTGGDPEKEAQFKRLAVFMQDVDKFRITPRSRGPEWNRVRNYPMNVRWVDMTSTTSSSGASFGDAFVSFVVNGRRVTFE
jgi:hypothetical protein